MNEQEVDLRDYIKLIFRNKWLIFGVFLLGIIMAGSLTFYFISNEVKTYEGKIWMEIGTIRRNTLIESPEQLMKKIQEGIYGGYLYGAVVSNPKNTNLIQVKIKAIKRGEIQAELKNVGASILAGHNERINIKKENIENEIGRLQTEIDLLKQEKENLETKMKNFVSQFDLFFFKDKLIEIEDLRLNIASLNSSLDDIQPTKILYISAISEKPITQNVLLNIIIGGLSGLFLGIFLAFLKEWWQAPRQNNYY